MTILSDKDVSSLINNLYYASMNQIPQQEQKQLYCILNTAVVNLKKIQNEDRFANIRTNLLQHFKEYTPSSHKQLLKWIFRHSIKLLNNEPYGPILPLIELFKILDTSKRDDAFHCSTLNVVRDIEFEFHPLKYIKSIHEKIKPREEIEKTINQIFLLLSLWEKIITKQDTTEDFPTTNKGNLFISTEKFITELKNKFEVNPEFNDLNLIVSQQLNAFNNYPWSQITAWISENSISEYDGAYQLFDDFMQLIFGLHPLPDGYVVARNSALKTINSNKFNGVKFARIFHLKDLKLTQFSESEILNKMLGVSKDERKFCIRDLIPLINQGVISNQTLKLDSASALIEYFGTENCKLIERLQFDVSQIHEITPQHLIELIVQNFPNIKHFSLTHCSLDALMEKYIKQLTKLECLKLINYKNLTWKDFPSELCHLTELEISPLMTDEKMNFSNLIHLKNLKKLKCRIENFENSEIIKQLCELEFLSVCCKTSQTDFLQKLKKLKTLKINGNFHTLYLEEFPLLEDLEIDTEIAARNITLRNLPLKKLNLQAVSQKIQINNLPELEEVDLGISVNDISGLKNSKKISKLSLNNYDVLFDLNWILKYPLEMLNIDSTALINNNMRILNKLPLLKVLNLSRCNYIFENTIEDILSISSLKKIIIKKNHLSSSLEERFKEKNILLIFE